MTVHFSRQALRDLRDMPRRDADRLMADFERLETVLHTGNLSQSGREAGVDIKRLTGSDGFRIRCGDWRALLVVEGAAEVSVMRIANRKDAYG